VGSTAGAPATAGAAPAAAAAAPSPPPGVAIVSAGTLLAGSVAGAPSPVAAAAGLDEEVDAAVAPVGSAPVDEAAGATAAVTGGVVDTVAAAAAAVAGPPPPSPVVEPLAQDCLRLAQAPTDALARRRGRPGGQGARAYCEGGRPAVTRGRGGGGPASINGMGGNRGVAGGVDEQMGCGFDRR